MIIGVTGGRNRPPTLAELEWVFALDPWRGPCVATFLRHGAGGLCDNVVGGFVRERRIAEEQRFPADWIKGRTAGPIRNRCMLDGERGELIKLPQVERLYAFRGGRGTRDCMTAAGERDIPITEVEPVVEPIPWNRHWRWSKLWGERPRQIYVGGNDRDPSKASPLANPYAYRVTPAVRRDQRAADEILGDYRKWLWARLDGPGADPRVQDALDSIEATDALVCSCWPGRCHVEVIVRAWRWWKAKQWR